MTFPVLRRYCSTPRTLTASTRHYWLLADGPHDVTKLPARLVIDDHGPVQGVFLFRFDDGGTCFADTWHRTVDEAHAQAEREYGVAPSEWSEVAIDAGDASD